LHGGCRVVKLTLMQTTERNLTAAHAAAPDFANRTHTLLQIATGGCWYLLLCVVGYVRVQRATGGHFVFTLDDPYIHMALSEGIARGHYGINTVEASSPSSSVLWPYLLALFARVHAQPMVVFGINVVAGLLAALLLGAMVARWPRVGTTRDELVRRLISIVGLVFVGNLVGLTFLGMEHTLQVLLTLEVAWGLVSVLREEQVPAWCLAAAVAGPMVRYENLGLSLALAIALWGQGRRRASEGVMAVSLAPLVCFSLFLRHLGLAWLPTSVIGKEGMSSGLDVGQRLRELVGMFVQRTPTTAEHWLLMVLALTLAGLAWNEPVEARRFALWGATIAAGAHLLFGRFGWGHRYEVYIVVFCVVVVLQVMHERPRMLLGWYVLGLAACSVLYVQSFMDIPANAKSVYLQQYQMHRFVTEFYSGNVAVGDLGLVSYRRRPGTYVLDLGGLASIEVQRQKDRSAAWLDELARRHDVGLVMMYPDLFKDVPADWSRVGEICNVTPPSALGGACVDYFATSAASTMALRSEFAAFAKTLPDGVRVSESLPSGLDVR
jgi:hypothetical protein